MKPLKSLINDLNRTLLDKPALKNHILFAINTKGNNDTQEGIEEDILQLKKEYQALIAQYESTRKSLEDMKSGNKFALEYDAAPEGNQLSMLGRLAAGEMSSLNYLRKNHSKYKDAIEKLSLLNLIIINDGENSNILVGDIADPLFVSTIEKKLLSFKSLAQSTSEVFQFDPKPFEAQLSEYLSVSFMQLGAMHRGLESNQDEIKQLEAIENGTEVDFVVREIIKYSALAKVAIRRLREYKSEVLHSPLFLENKNQSTFSFYPTFSVKPYKGFFTNLEKENTIVDSDTGITYQLIPSTFNFDLKTIPENTIYYQSDTWKTLTPNAPKQSVGQLLGLKATHPDQLGNFNNFKEEMKKLSEDIDKFISSSSWLSIVDKETYKALLKILGGLEQVILNKDHVGNTDITGNYLDRSVDCFEKVNDLIEILERKLPLDQIENIKIRLKAYKVQQAGIFYNRKEIEIEKDNIRLIREIQLHELENNELKIQLKKIKETLGTPALDFALNILEGKNSIKEGVKKISAGSIYENKKEENRGEVISSVVAGYIAFSCFNSMRAKIQFDTSQCYKKSSGFHQDIQVSSGEIKPLVASLSISRAAVSATGRFFSPKPITSKLLPFMQITSKALRFLK